MLFGLIILYSYVYWKYAIRIYSTLKNLRLYACNLHVICLYSYLIKELFHLLFAQLTRAAIRHAIGYPRKHLGVTLLAKILDRRQHTHDVTMLHQPRA